MSKQLSRLKIDEVSIVDSGANQKRFFLMKRKGEDMPELIKKILEDTAAVKGLEALTGETLEGSTAIVKILKSIKGLPENILETISKAAGYTTPTLSQEEIDVLVTKAVQDKADAEKAKAGDINKADIEKMKDVPENVKKMLEVMTEKLEKSEKDNTERLEKAEKENKENREKIEKAEAEKIRKELVTKAKDFPLVGAADSLADILVKLSLEDQGKLSNVFKATNARIEKGALFKEIGSDGDSVASGDKVQKKAEEIRKANPKLTSAQAYDEALQANPELFTV